MRAGTLNTALFLLLAILASGCGGAESPGTAVDEAKNGQSGLTSNPPEEVRPADAVLDVIVLDPAGDLGPVGSVAVDATLNIAVATLRFGQPQIIDLNSREVIGQLTLPGGPFHRAVVDSTSHQLYAIGSQGSQYALVVVDLSSKSVVATVPVGRAPFDVALDAGRGLAYLTTPSGSVAQTSQEPITVVDVVAHEVRSTSMVPAGPLGIALDSEQRKIYVTSGRDTVTVVDATTFEVVEVLKVGNFPRDVKTDPGAQLAIVSNAGDGSVTLIDTTTDTVIVTIAIEGAGAIAVDAELHVAYIRGDSGATVLNTMTHEIVGEIGFDAASYGIVDIGVSSVDPLTHRVYFATGSSVTVLGNE